MACPACFGTDGWLGGERRASSNCFLMAFSSTMNCVKKRDVCRSRQRWMEGRFAMPWKTCTTVVLVHQSILHNMHMQQNESMTVLASSTGQHQDHVHRGQSQDTCQTHAAWNGWWNTATDLIPIRDPPVQIYHSHPSPCEPAILLSEGGQSMCNHHHNRLPSRKHPDNVMHQGGNAQITVRMLPT